MKKIKVILQQDFPSLGFLGDEVEVRGGYARNYLFRQGIAFEGSNHKSGLVQHKLAMVKTKRQRLRSEAEKMTQEIEGVIPEFTLKAGEGGKAFGSVTNRDISKWLEDKGFKIDKSQIVLHEPVKKAGEYPVKIRLHSEVSAQIKVRVAVEAVAPKAEVSEAGIKKPRRGRGRSRRSEGDSAESAAENQADNQPQQ